MAKRVSLTVTCHHCGSVRRYIGDPASAVEWRRMMRGKTCACCGKRLQ